MSKEPHQQYPPGPELDKIIAIDFMKWNEKRGIFFDENNEILMSIENWQPSSNSIQALRILRELQEIGNLFMEWAKSDQKGWWYISNISTDEVFENSNSTNYTIRARTFEHAICLAALEVSK